MRGMTLIEILIYISLLSLMLMGIFSSLFMIIRSEEGSNKWPEEDAIILNQKLYE